MNNIQFENEKKLEYIKTCIGESLVKSLLLAIKSDADNPLKFLSNNLKNIKLFNELKNKRKEFLLNKLNSYKIKIQEINKYVESNSLKKLYDYINEENLENVNFNIITNIIKEVFEVKNVYIGKLYRNENKENNFIKFLYTTDYLDNLSIITNDNLFFNIFEPLKINEHLFEFEKNYLFNDIINRKYVYYDTSEKLFCNINPFYNYFYLKRIFDCFNDDYIKKKNNEKGKYKNKIKKKKEEEEKEEIEEEEKEEKEEIEEEEEKEKEKDGEEKEKEEEEEEEDDEKDEEKTTNENNSNEKECLNTENELIKHLKSENNKENNKGNKDNNNNNKNKELNKDNKDNDNKNKDENKNLNEEEKEIKYIKEILNLNLKYKGLYIYEIMEKKNFFLYSLMKPGDFLCIPIIYYTFYNYDFLNKLYLYKKYIYKKEKIEKNNNKINENIKNENIILNMNEEIKEKYVKPQLIISNGKKIEICICLDNRETINKISKKNMNNLINFSYYFITCLFFSEKKFIEQQVNYLIDCELGEEKKHIDKLQNKIENKHYEKKYEKNINDININHPYLNISKNLINYMTQFIWIRNKISKNSNKIFEIKKIKVEYNKTFVISLLSCFILFEYNYEDFTFSNKLIDYEWNKIILNIDNFFIDKLISFNPLIFEEKTVDFLINLKKLLNEIETIDNNDYPFDMKNLKIYAIVALNFYKSIIINILDEILEIRK